MKLQLTHIRVEAIRGRDELWGGDWGRRRFGGREIHGKEGHWVRDT